MKRDSKIQWIRIISMLLIVFCHIFEEIDLDIFHYIASLFSVGVYIFLFISGYLYGKKDTIKYKSFLWNRFIKILVPIYIFVIYISVILLYKREFELQKFIGNMLNLSYFLGGLNGITHFWFLTELMICYFITPILFRYKEKLLRHKKIFYMFIFVFSILLSICNKKCGILAFYTIIYIYGFLYNRKLPENKSIKLYVKSVVIIIIMFTVRIFTRRWLDGTILYDVMIVGIIQSIIAIEIIYIICVTFKVGNNKILDLLDNLSYFVYITHYQYIVGPVALINITNSLLLNSISIIIVSLLSAYILMLLTKSTSSNIIKCLKQKNIV